MRAYVLPNVKNLFATNVVSIFFKYGSVFLIISLAWLSRMYSIYPVKKMVLFFDLTECSLVFCRTCFSMGDLGVQISVRLSVRSSTFTMGVL